MLGKSFVLRGDCPWTYGAQSPNPQEYNINIYGGFIVVRTPPELPKVDDIVVVWASVSSSEWFYQTSLGYHKDYGWHVSAGACSRWTGTHHPDLPCGCSCPPFKLGNQIFRPKPNHVYELGIRFIPKDSGYKVYLYFVDLETNSLYNIFVLNDDNLPQTPVGGMLEAFTTEESELIKIGNDNAFKIETTNWLIEPWISERWPHATAYGPEPLEEVENIKDHLQIKLLSPGKFYIGYDVGGKHYESGESLW